MIAIYGLREVINNVSNITTASSRRKQFKTVYVSCTEMLIRRLFVVQKVITSVSGTQTIGRFITLSLYPAAILQSYKSPLYYWHNYS